MTEAVRVQYTGAALPGNAAVVSLFDTTVAFPGGEWLAMFHMKRLLVDIFNNQAGTLNWYKSRGKRAVSPATTTWDNIGTAAVALVAAGATNSFDFAIPMYEEFKLEWTNGAAPQTVFDVDMALSDEINKVT
jgi:hypothetical protein